MSNRIGSGRVFGAHFGLESAFGGGGAMSASTLLKALNDTTIDIQDQARHANDESTGSRDRNKDVAGKYQPVPVTINHYLRLQQDGSTASVLEKLIQAAMGEAAARVTPSGKTVGAGSTAQVIKVTTGTDFQLFDVVVINGEAAVVGKVEAAQITLKTPLSAAPSTGDSIISTRTYHLKQELPSCYGYFKRDHVVEYVKGGVVKTMALTPAAEDTVKVTFGMEFSRQVVTGETELATDASGTVTTLDVVNAKAFEVGSKFDIGSETGIEVTAVDYANNQITVTRGASPAAHSTGDACVPTWTDGTVTGSIAHGKGGACRRADGASAVSIPATSRSISLDNAARLVNDEDGTDYPSYKIEGDRTITNERTIHFRRDDIAWLRDAQNAVSMAEIYQVAAGARGLAVAFPDVELRVPAIADGDMLDLTQASTVGIATDSDGAEVVDRAMVVATW